MPDSYGRFRQAQPDLRVKPQREQIRPEQREHRHRHQPDDRHPAPERDLVVVQGHDHPLLLKRSLRAEDTSWTSGRLPDEAVHSAKTRYRQADAECTLTRTDTGIEVDFAAPQWAVTPGQSVVLYDREVCLGGGVIT